MPIVNQWNTNRTLRRFITCLLSIARDSTSTVVLIAPIMTIVPIVLTFAIVATAAVTLDMSGHHSSTLIRFICY